MNKIKSILIKAAASAVLAIAPLAAFSGMSHATVGGTLNWTGHGADSVKACTSDQTPFLHWIFTTGGSKGNTVSSATLAVTGNTTGGGPMTQHGLSWTIDTGYGGTAQPTTTTLHATVTYTGSLGEGTANLNISDGCFGSGGEGGGQMDCDNDFDSSPQSDCTSPQKDCDNDFDNSPSSDCNTVTGPTTDCDGDTDSSPATECTTPGQVLGTTTTPGKGAVSNQVSVLPQGSVNGGGGAASSTVSKVSAIGLVVSLLSAGAGLAVLNRRQS